MPALKIGYIAMSPQKLRTGSDYPGTYEVGDRLASRPTYGGYSYSESADVWVCTTAGTMSSYLSPNYSYNSTYSSGTTVWTRQASTGWSTALPEPPPYSNPYFTAGAEANTRAFFYVDADYELTSGGGYGIFVCVDRVTMLPRKGRAIIRVDTGLSYHADIFSEAGRRSGSRIHNNTKPHTGSSYNGSYDIIRETRCTIPLKRALNSSGTYGFEAFGIASRIRIRGATALAYSGKQGVGLVMEAPEVTTAPTDYRVKDGSMVFTKLPNVAASYDVSRVITVNSSAIATRDLYRGSATYGGTSAKPDPPRYNLGQNCKLEWVTHTYRNGAAPTGSENGSLRWVGTGNANSAPWTSGYIYLFNSLTGARTLKVFFYTDSLYVGDITNKDMWVEVFYPNAAASGYVMADTANANWGIPNVVGTVIPASAETWTTNQTGTFQKLEIAVALTIGRAGMIAVRLRNLSNRVGLSKIFVDPYMTVT